MTQRLKRQHKKLLKTDKIIIKINKKWLEIKIQERISP